MRAWLRHWSPASRSIRTAGITAPARTSTSSARVKPSPSRTRWSPPMTAARLTLLRQRRLSASPLPAATMCRCSVSRRAMMSVRCRKTARSASAASSVQATSIMPPPRPGALPGQTPAATARSPSTAAVSGLTPWPTAPMASPVPCSRCRPARVTTKCSPSRSATASAVSTPSR